MNDAIAFPDDVDVAVVSHNGRQTLPGVLTCLVAAGAPRSRVTVYDIASTDGTAEWLTLDWSGVRVVRLPTNDGPNPARNRAIGDAMRRYLLLVDSDAYLQSEAPAALRKAIDARPDVGAVVPVVVQAEQPDRIQYASGRLHFLCEAINPWSGRPIAARGPDVREIGTAPGVTFLLDVEQARRVGGFDERYFMGKEDGEFCFRLRLAGSRLIETPHAVAVHATRPRSTWLFPYQVRNRWHFMLKNYELTTLVAIAPALLVHEILQVALLASRGEARAWWRGLRGLLAWLGSLRADRRGVAILRRVHDRHLLDADPLVVREDIIGRGPGKWAKDAYDRALSSYWRLASRLLP